MINVLLALCLGILIMTFYPFIGAIIAIVSIYKALAIAINHNDYYVPNWLHKLAVIEVQNHKDQE